MDRLFSGAGPAAGRLGGRISNACAMMQRPPVPQHPGAARYGPVFFFRPCSVQRESYVLLLAQLSQHTFARIGLSARWLPQTPRWRNRPLTSRRSPWCWTLRPPRAATTLSCSKARQRPGRTTGRPAHQHHPRALRCVACVRQLRPSTNAPAAIYPSMLLALSATTQPCYGTMKYSSLTLLSQLLNRLQQGPPREPSSRRHARAGPGTSQRPSRQTGWSSQPVPSPRQFREARLAVSKVPEPAPAAARHPRRDPTPVRRPEQADSGFPHAGRP